MSAADRDVILWDQRLQQELDMQVFAGASCLPKHTRCHAVVVAFTCHRCRQLDLNIHPIVTAHVCDNSLLRQSDRAVSEPTGRAQPERGTGGAGRAALRDPQAAGSRSYAEVTAVQARVTHYTAVYRGSLLSIVQRLAYCDLILSPHSTLLFHTATCSYGTGSCCATRSGWSATWSALCRSVT